MGKLVHSSCFLVCYWYLFCKENRSEITSQRKSISWKSKIFQGFTPAPLTPLGGLAAPPRKPPAVLSSHFPQIFYSVNFFLPWTHLRIVYTVYSAYSLGVAARIGRFPVQNLLGGRPGLGTQPHYEAWECPLENGPKLVMGQPNSS